MHPSKPNQIIPIPSSNDISYFNFQHPFRSWQQYLGISWGVTSQPTMSHEAPEKVSELWSQEGHSHSEVPDGGRNGTGNRDPDSLSFCPLDSFGASQGSKPMNIHL